MTVQELIDALAVQPNPESTNVQVEVFIGRWSEPTDARISAVRLARHIVVIEAEA